MEKLPNQWVALADLCDDTIVYRDLEPQNPALARRAAINAALGQPDDCLPRKMDAQYAHMLLYLLQQAQEQRGGKKLETILVLGDTDNDRMVAHTLVTSAPVRTFGFIAHDQRQNEATLHWDGAIATANRWALVSDWLREVETALGATLPWETTGIIVDIDKTLLGPRGRTDQVIDAARADAAWLTAQRLLQPAPDEQHFREVYTLLCRKEYHGLTRDNQDYVAYLTLLITSGIVTLERVQGAAGLGGSGLQTSFADLLTEVVIPAEHALAQKHAIVSAASMRGDPTPFKAFRRAEFELTTGAMRTGALQVCHELYAQLLHLKNNGALILAASDKPTEASLPTTSEQREAGLLSLHRTPALLDS